jgi:hypothetical protein
MEMRGFWNFRDGFKACGNGACSFRGGFTAYGKQRV